MATKPTNVNYRDNTKRRSRADRLAKGSVVDDSDLVVNGEDSASRQREIRYDIIARTVDDNIRSAINARESSGIEEVWREDEDQYNGIDDASAPYSRVKTRDQVPRNKKDGRSKVFVPITKPKTDIGVARVSEMLLPNDDRPWDIDPTPMPDIDEELEAPPEKMTTLGDGSQAPAALVAQFVKDKAKGYAEAEATWIEDKFVEGEVYSEMRQVVRDAGRIGTGVLKGPFPMRRITNKWDVIRNPAATPSPVLASANGKTLQAVENESSFSRTGLSGATAKLRRIERIEPTSVAIRVQDCYPDPSCGDSIHKGAFFAERAFLTGKALRDLAFLPGYDAKAIVLGLKEGPGSYARRHDATWRPVAGDTNYDSKLFEVFYYYGEASPDDLELLMENGNAYPDEGKDDEDEADEGKADDEFDKPSPLDAVLSKEERRFLRSVPIVCTMLNGRPIKAELNPMEVGGFPYDFFPWEPVKGQPYGRGIPRKMAVAQRMLNASVRAMLENAGLSAGAQIVFTAGCVRPYDNDYAISGRKLWEFTPNESGIDDVRKAFSVFSIPSVMEELQRIITMSLEFADLLTNLPMLMQGDQQAGTSPETLGGLKLLFNNAMSPLRVIAKLFDDKLIVPHLKRYHDWGMEKGPDGIKGGDSQIVAKGSTALIQREEGREFLMQVFPVKDDPKLRIDPAKLIKEMARSNGFDMATVQYTEDEWKEIEQKMAENPPPPEPTVQAAEIRSKALVESATIKAEAEKMSNEFKKMQAELDRAHEAAETAVDREIAQMELEGKRSDALVAMKARLAEVAATNRLKSDEMQLKLMPSNPSGLGI